MEKILLVISKKDPTLYDSYKDNLIKKFPKSELLSILSEEEVWASLKKPFFLLISPIDFFENMERLKAMDLNGTVILLDSSVEEKESINDNILIYKDLNTFSIDLYLMNRDVFKNDLKKKLERNKTKETKEHIPSATTKESTSETIKKYEQKESNQNAELENNNKEIVKRDSKDEEDGPSTKPAEKGEKLEEPPDISEEPNLSKPVVLENYPNEDMLLFNLPSDAEMRSELNIKEYFSYDKRDGNRIIGVWSPQRFNGVSTFVLNFSIYFKQYNFNIAVLEALTKNPFLKRKLDMCKSNPKNWMSFYESIFCDEEEYKTKNVRWRYRGIDWHPLRKEDLDEKTWNKKLISLYINNLKLCNFGFVDLPSEQAKEYTIDTINLLDELWIIVDNKYAEDREWLTYIREVFKKCPNIQKKLIFTRCYSKDRAKYVANQLNIPLLTTIPSLEIEVQKNETESFPLIDKKEVKEILNPSFEEIATYLLGTLEPHKPTIWRKMKRLLIRG